MLFHYLFLSTIQQNNLNVIKDDVKSAADVALLLK